MTPRPIDSDFHDLGFLVLQELVDLVHVFVVDLLEILFRVLHVVLAHAIELLEVIARDGSRVPHRNAPFFGELVHDLHELFPALLVGTAVLIWSGLRPADRMVWVMEVIPSVVGVGALVLTWRRFPMSMVTYRLIFVFSLILFVGGKYTYAEVPLGFWVKDLSHLQRNHFDRLGHFFQGVVPAILTGGE